MYACSALKGIDVRISTGSPWGFRFGAVVVALALAVLSCSVALAQAPATAPTTAAASSAPPAVPAPSQPTSSADAQPGVNAKGVGPDYVIGPGDTLQVFVWRNPELTTSVPVRPDGKITTPLVDDIVAVGKTPPQLARDVEARLAEYVRSPQVSIIVTNAVSAYSQITVVGQVKDPRAIPFREGMTVMDAVLQTGGLTDFAAGNRAKLIRKDAHGKQQEIKVHLEDLLKKGKLSENLTVKPGDVLLIPESYF